MQITFDTSNPQDLELINKIIAFAQGVEAHTKDAQPQVAQNSGSTATGSTLSPEGSGVSGADAQVSEQAQSVSASAAPAPEKKTRAKKPVGSATEAAPTSTPAAEPTENAQSATTDKPTIDTVRAALQAFTAAKGVPAGIELLQKFGAGRISELAEEHYIAFVQGCAA